MRVATASVRQTSRAKLCKRCVNSRSHAYNKSATRIMNRLSYRAIIVGHDLSNRTNFHMVLLFAGPELVARITTLDGAIASSSWCCVVPEMPRYLWMTMRPPLCVSPRLCLRLLHSSSHGTLFVLWLSFGILKMQRYFLT